MGGCAGKNKSKSDSNKKPKDDPEQVSSPQEYQNESTVKDDDSNIQTPSDQFDGLNKALSQILSSRVISISDSEVEYELAYLIYGHPEHDYAENPPIAAKFKSTDV